MYLPNNESCECINEHKDLKYEVLLEKYDGLVDKYAALVDKYVALMNRQD